METLQGIIITVCTIAMIMSLCMMLATMRVKDTLRESFRCKYCKRLNKLNSGKCLFCGEPMGKGMTYKSTFFGKTDSRNKEGHFEYKKMEKIISREIFMWALTMIVLAVIIGCAAIFL